MTAEVVLGDPCRLKAAAGAGVEVIAVAKGAFGLGPRPIFVDAKQRACQCLRRTGTERELATARRKLATTQPWPQTKVERER